VAYTQAAFLQTWLFLGEKLDKESSDETIRERYFSAAAEQNPQEQETNSRHSTITMTTNVPWEPNQIHPQAVKIISEAKSSLDMEFPYLVLDDIINAMSQSARRGRQVKVLLPGTCIDSVFEPVVRSVHYGQYLGMMRSGVKVYEYTADTKNGAEDGGYDHGKIIIADLNGQNTRVKIDTGNYEPGLSGGPTGGILFDMSAVIETNDDTLRDQLRETLARDFSVARSNRIQESDVTGRSAFSQQSTRLLTNLTNVLFPSSFGSQATVK